MQSPKGKVNFAKFDYIKFSYYFHQSYYKSKKIKK